MRAQSQAQPELGSGSCLAAVTAPQKGWPGQGQPSAGLPQLTEVFATAAPPTWDKCLKGDTPRFLHCPPVRTCSGWRGPLTALAGCQGREDVTWTPQQWVDDSLAQQPQSWLEPSMARGGRGANRRPTSEDPHGDMLGVGGG